MESRIAILKEKKLVGKRMTMSFAINKTKELWQDFMPQRKEIKNIAGIELFSVEVYPSHFFNPFDPEKEFEKWAAVEVTDYDSIPGNMERLILPEGLYSVFIHKGPAYEAPTTYHYIFDAWLPQSGYLLDDRPHFALMGEKYRHDDPDSEEEIWIPVKRM